MKEKRYIFTLHLSGSGTTPEAAWNEAIDGILSDTKQLAFDETTEYTIVED